MSTHYESLHVTEDAPDEVIRASYRVLCLKHHPDTAGDRPHSLRKMQRINDAYAVLSDTAKRGGYDAELRRMRNPSSAPPMAAPAHIPATRRRSHDLLPSTPHWLRGILGWLCDARVVLPVVAIIWLVVYWVVSQKQ